MRIDLHTHSAVSDGTDSPADLVTAAAAAGLDVVGVTDHDTTASWTEASAAAARAGITLVRGTEMSTQLRGRSVHLLAYLFDPDDVALAAELDRIRDDRLPRLQEMTRRLREVMGVDVTWEDVLAQATSAESVGRPHLADALVARGHVSTRDEAFATLIHWQSPAYVAKYAPSTVTAIELVRSAGGVPVVAHPWAGNRAGVLDAEVLRSLVDVGLAGLEADHVDHDGPTRAALHALAAELGIFATGSSDHHGTGKQGFPLGVCTTDPWAYERLVAEVGPRGLAPTR